MTERKPIDWESIERDYRAGLLSVREIASAHSTSHTAINKRAKRDGWDRDLKAKIQARADALVSKREVSREVSTIGAETEREIVETNAMAIVSVRLNHRTDIQRSRTLASMLLEELESMSGSRELYLVLGKLIENIDEDDGHDKLSAVYRGVMSLPGRTKVMRELAETLKTLIGLERQAYNLDEQQHEETYEDRLKRLMGD